jgi:hypothetical protein
MATIRVAEVAVLICPLKDRFESVQVVDSRTL